jgi:tRNA(Ile)-lysidine synthase
MVHPDGPFHTALISRVSRDISKYEMLGKGDRVLAAVSGGADSTALLHLVLTMRRRYDLTIGVAHLHHGLRAAAADRDAAFVEKTAKALSLPFHFEAADPGTERRSGMSPEDAARRRRYRFLAETARARGYNRVALGHHLDDNAEWIFINLLTGGGPEGLSGISPVRPLFEAPGNPPVTVIRPLISCRKAELTRFLETRGIDFVFDETNTDPRFLRNRIRHQLFPQIETDFNPGFRETLSRLGEVMRRENEWIKKRVDALFSSMIVVTRTSTVLPVKRLQRSPAALTRRLIRRALFSLPGDAAVSLVHTDACRALLNDDADGKGVDLPGGVRVRRVGDRLIFPHGPAASPPDCRHHHCGTGRRERP